MTKQKIAKNLMELSFEIVPLTHQLGSYLTKNGRIKAKKAKQASRIKALIQEKASRLQELHSQLEMLMRIEKLGNIRKLAVDDFLTLKDECDFNADCAECLDRKTVYQQVAKEIEKRLDTITKEIYK